MPATAKRRRRLTSPSDTPNECSVEALNLFEGPLYQTAIKSSEWIDVKPLTGIDRSTSTIKVHYQGKSGVTVDLSRTIVSFVTEIVRADGTPVNTPRRAAPAPPPQSGGGGATPTTAAAIPEAVGLINYIAGSLFQSVDVELNGRNVCSSNNNYAHRAYLEVLSTYSASAKKTWLKCGGYYDNSLVDIPRNASTTQNEPFEKTKIMYKHNQTVTWAGPLHLDLCHQHRHILPNVNMLFTFVLNPSKYVLQRAADDTENYQFIVKDFTVKFLECTLSDAELMYIESQLARSPALYPITRVDVRSFNVPKGSTNFSEDNCFVGQIPQRILIAMVQDKAYTGSYDTTPHNYAKTGVDHIQLIVGGRAIPALPLQPSGYVSNAHDEYLSVMAGLGNLFEDTDIGLTPDDWWALGNNIYVFSMQPHLPPDCVAPVQTGNVRIQLRFRSALAEAQCLIMYAEYNNMMFIDKNRNVTTDY